MSLLATIPHVDAIVHLAGLAHVPVDRLDRALLWRLNVNATQQLAEFAASQQAHFVYLSSAKVLGECGEWNDDALPAPADPYAESKLAAELALLQIRDLSATIVRTPLVYGPYVKGNFLQLLRLVNTGWPLPLALDTQRSMIYVENLASAILTILENKQASMGHTWLVSDGQPIGLDDLIRNLGHALGRNVRLFHVKPSWLIDLARLARLQDAVRKLTEPFVIRDIEIRHSLSWTPPFRTTQGLSTTAEWFLSC